MTDVDSDFVSDTLKVVNTAAAGRHRKTISVEIGHLIKMVMVHLVCGLPIRFGMRHLGRHF